MRFLTWIMVFAVLAGQPAQLLRNRAQVRTVRSLTELEEGRLFRLDYKADYRLQDFVDADLDSKEAVQGGVAQMLLDFSSLPAGSLSRQQKFRSGGHPSDRSPLRTYLPSHRNRPGTCPTGSLRRPPGRPPSHFPPYVFSEPGHRFPCSRRPRSGGSRQ